MDRLIMDFANSATQAVGAGSASFSLPGNAAGKNNTYYIATAANAHFRIGVGAQTAVATDPMIQPGFPLMVVCPTGADTMGVIQDTAGGNLTVTRMMEG
jgi:hypothetical protein